MGNRFIVCGAGGEGWLLAASFVALGVAFGQNLGLIAKITGQMPRPYGIFGVAEFWYEAIRSALTLALSQKEREQEF